jgi:succinate dehydrogenase / fumarate reductase iron-sulfur subunit
MKLYVDITRFDPRSDSTPRVQRFMVEAEPTERVLDVLLTIKRDQDATLSFRYSCAHGVCGSDAMRINGRERLACKTLVRDVTGATQEGAATALPGAKTAAAGKAAPAAEPQTAPDGTALIRVEPLRHFPVERDLVVDQTEFIRRLRSVAPYLLPAEGSTPDNGREILQTQQQHSQFEDATKCISCGACFSACPVLETNPRFIGPAAIVQAARFVEDSRDWGLAPRLDALDQPDGVWSCENHFECTRVCPREIKVTRLINLMKRRVTQERTRRGETVHDGAAKGA